MVSDNYFVAFDKIAHESFLQFHGGFLQFHGGFLQFHEAFLQFHKGFLQFHGASMALNFLENSSVRMLLPSGTYFWPAKRNVPLVTPVHPTIL